MAKSKEVVAQATSEAELLPTTSFLKNEKVTIKYIKRESAYIKDPKHVGYGGLFEGSSIAIPAPLLSNERMKNILTKEEKAGLEHLLGKDLSIYGDFWKQAYKKGSLFPIFLGKDDTRLDLSNPMQYIVYKVLLVSPIVANSLDEVRHKATYRFVMVREGDEIQREKDAVGNKVIAYENYVKYKNNKSVLRYVLRNLGRFTSKAQKLDFLQIEASKLIEKDPNMFVAVTTDKNLETKVLIEEAVEFGVIDKMDKKFYTKEGQPISEGDVPSLDVAATYLASPLGQEMRLAIEAKIKNARE